jgi:hypothetical protein
VVGKSEGIDAMRLRHPCNPAEDELRAWAYDPEAREPVQDWDLVLSWQVDRGFLSRCVAYAADPSCPKADFFLDVLFQWVETTARSEHFDVLRATLDGWLDVARGVTDRRVKDWRHQARLVFQGVEPFERERWLTIWLATRRET